MRHESGALLALVVAAICYAPFQVRAQAAPCPSSLIDYTQTIPSLSTFTKFAKLYANTGFDPQTNQSFAVFAPTDDAWARLFAEIGTTLSPNSTANSSTAPGPSQGAIQLGLNSTQVDTLLSVGLYHYTLDGQPSPAAYLAAHNVNTALGDFTGFNVSLFFEETAKKQIQVEGIPLGNSAPLSKAVQVCNASVYVIDTVLRPARHLMSVPPYTALVSAQGTGGGPVGDQGVFDLPLPADSPGISVTATGGSPGGSTTGNTTGGSLNGVASLAQPPISRIAVASTNSTQAATALSPSALLLNWQACAATMAAVLALPALL